MSPLPHLHPSDAKFGIRIAVESAYVGADQGNPVKVEIQNAGDRRLEIAPSGRVIAEPVTAVLTRVRKGGA